MRLEENHVLLANKFSGYVFGLKKDKFDNILTDDVEFSYKAILVDRQMPVPVQTGTFKGKEAVQAAFAQSIFGITKQVVLEKFGSKPFSKNQVRVDFTSVEIKESPATEESQENPKLLLNKYLYNGHFIVTFVNGPAGEIKVSRIVLDNLRQVEEQEELEKPAPVEVD